MDRIIDQGPQWTNRRVFNNETLFRLENYRKIKMMFLLMDITPSAPTTYTLPTSPYIIENCLMECEGLQIARTTTTYTLSRIDKNQNYLYDQIYDASSLKGTFNAEQTISMPLYFWFYDGQVLDTDIYGKLTLRVQSKGTRQEMGFNVDPQSLYFRLRVIYEDSTIPRPLDFSKAYGCFQYYKVTVPNGSSYFRTTLQLQHKVRSLAIMIRSNTNAGTKGLINRVTLTRTNGIKNVYDSLTNYYLNTKLGSNDGNVFNVNFNSYEYYNEQFKPIVCELDYNTLASESSLYISYEYDATYETFSDSIEGKTLMRETEPMVI